MVGGFIPISPIAARRDQEKHCKFHTITPVNSAGLLCDNLGSLYRGAAIGALPAPAFEVYDHRIGVPT
jgi:hypothetical protein